MATFTPPDWETAGTDAWNYERFATSCADAALTELDRDTEYSIARAQVYAALAQTNATLAAGERVADQVAEVANMIDNMPRG